ncbi:copper resistance protein NlpE [Pedobacter nyackensis]|uniref:copper resistance protein NlpE n=1 Tax=Pedobacter nyackensis TaxID=475255 RepID=UPI002931E6AC|nr:copper resistance protein NlpE [Pedobacter nyackensis]
MKKQIFSIALASIVIWGCNSATKQSSLTDSTAVSDGIDTLAVDKVPGNDTHNAQNSLDWAGTYKGVTPCADCEGIETEVTLTSDMTFVIKTKYKGKGEKVFEETGSFKWDDKGSNITLEGLKDRPTQFFVGENTLTQLDMNGNKVTGDLAEKYILKK